MQKKKKNVLGMDPLGWLKGKNNEEKSGGNISEQKIQMDIPSETKDEDTELNIQHTIQEENVSEPSNITETHNLQEEKVYEPSDVTEAYRKSILGEKAYDYRVKPQETTQKESPATVFVIVYTILLLILGFIVYRDLTKQIDKLETKLANIEKQVDSGLLSYEDTKDVW